MHQRRDERADVCTLRKHAQRIIVPFQPPQIAHGFPIGLHRGGIGGFGGEVVADVAVEFSTHGGDFGGAEESTDEHDAVALVVLKHLQWINGHGLDGLRSKAVIMVSRAPSWRFREDVQSSVSVKTSAFSM